MGESTEKRKSSIIKLSRTPISFPDDIIKFPTLYKKSLQMQRTSHGLSFEEEETSKAIDRNFKIEKEAVDLQR